MTTLSAYPAKLLRALHALQLRRTLQLLWQTGPGWLFLLVALLVLENGAFLAAMYNGKLLVAAVGKLGAGGLPATYLYRLLAITAACTLLYTALRTVAAFLSEKQAMKVAALTDSKIHDCALALDYAFFESPAYYDILKRAVDAGGEKPQAILLNLVELVKQLQLLCGLLGLLFSIHWLLLPIMVVFMLPLVVIKLVQAGRLFALRQRHTRLERRTAYLGELITGSATAKEIRSFGTGAYLAGLRRRLFGRLLQQRLHLRKTAAWQEGLITASVLLGLFGCVAFICVDALEGQKGVGDLALFLVVFPQLNMVLFGLSGSLAALYANSRFTTHLFSLFDLQPAPAATGRQALPPIASGWSLCDICFTYPQGGRQVLSNVTMALPPGRIVALVGVNGAGKTTLIKLLTRLYAPTKGRICVEGKDIGDLLPEAYRAAVSVVFQDFGRYALSAAENIRLGDINRVGGPAALRAVAQAADALFIDALPQGFDTPLCRLLDEGQELSAGQWQKIALARALYRKARLLVLDEATNTLDAAAERRFFEGLRQNLGEGTALVISHRLSAVQHADYIYVMNEGRVVQEGTHTQLLAAGGVYTDLYQKKPRVLV